LNYLKADLFYLVLFRFLQIHVILISNGRASSPLYDAALV